MALTSEEEDRLTEQARGFKRIGDTSRAAEILRRLLKKKNLPVSTAEKIEKN